MCIFDIFFQYSDLYNEDTQYRIHDDGWNIIA